MVDKIKVLIVDDIAETRANIVRLMEFQKEITIVAEASNAEEAIAKVKDIQPDIILMDVNMPGMDGIAATEIITSAGLRSAVIVMSVQGDTEYFNRAMMAGAKDYLTKPFTGDELMQAIRNIYVNEKTNYQPASSEIGKNTKLGKVITVFSTKGGIGKTTIATNLSVALANNMDFTVGIIDADLQFGDVSLFLNLLPKSTIADLVKDIEELDGCLLEKYLTTYNDKVKVLAAPLRPEQAETISAQHLTDILQTMKTMFDYIVVDTAPVFNDTMLAVLDVSDVVLVVSSLDLPTIKNIKLCLEIMESLNYSKEKIKVILNRANSEGGMKQHEVEEKLNYIFSAELPSEGKVVVPSVNHGIPFIISDMDSEISKSILKLAQLVSNV